MTSIEFENISKQYRLGLVSTRTLSHDLNRWWQTAVLRREDPYLKIGETNDRSTHGTSDYVWALRDINFKVEQGDVVGIIGKNGAGKSTLLKLLSKVTSPTTGTIRARGRIASLLEVGTGFHGEMTGRENIYLNGAIMGMTKQEIDRKLDEIVDFSGCERYIDTPVKRYSSGMTVRLGFAVAAHLDPEILVVDEVLAVGDAEFQKKAIGKMQDISHGEGRTVLFVSHNMESIGKLCKTCLLLENGKLKTSGSTQEIISSYLTDNFIINSEIMKDRVVLSGGFEIYDFKILQNNHETDVIHQGDPYSISFVIVNNSNFAADFVTNIELKSASGEGISCFGNEFQNFPVHIKSHAQLLLKMDMGEVILKQGEYYLSPYFSFDYNHKTENTSRYIEYGKKISVQQPTSLYLSNSNKMWNRFPTKLAEHGFMASQIKEFSICEL